MKFIKIQGQFKALKTICLAALLLNNACSSHLQQVDEDPSDSMVLLAGQLFNGDSMLSDQAVLIEDNKIVSVSAIEDIDLSGKRLIDLSDSTVLPGFIESHAHLRYKKIPEAEVLQHGITTLRDLGGPLQAEAGGGGHLRLLTAGPILTAHGGYPIPVLGHKDIAIAVGNATEARQTVAKLISQGAALIKIALEPGGESGAPWSSGMHAHHGHAATGAVNHHAAQSSWPLLNVEIVQAIVDEAHRLGKKVSVHVGEDRGVEIALQAGVDEWSHVPCEAISDSLLKQAGAQKISVISTLDTFSKCHGVQHNARKLPEYGARIIYGAEIAHPDVPWGIDAQELIYLHQYTGMNRLQVLASATSEAAKNLGKQNLGVIKPGAIADIIAVSGNPLENFKILEYPNFVMSGGSIVVNKLSIK